MNRQPCMNQRMTCEPNRSPQSRQQLLRFINEISFAVVDTLLYLDTHPNDLDALEFFRIHNRKRNAALREYEQRFGPLTIETADDSVSRSWEWMQQPWPWEGGAV